MQTTMKKLATAAACSRTALIDALVGHVDQELRNELIGMTDAEYRRAYACGGIDQSLENAAELAA